MNLNNPSFRVARKLKVGELVRTTDFCNAKSNQGNLVWKEWSADLPVLSGGWQVVETVYKKERVLSDNLLAYARIS